MDDFLKNVSTVSWWVGVVGVSIVIGILSSYLRDWIDVARSALPSRLRRRSDAAKERHAKLVESLRDNPHGEIVALGMETRYRLRSFASYGTGFTSGIVGIFIRMSVDPLEGVGPMPFTYEMVVAAAAFVWLFAAFNLYIGFYFSNRATSLERALGDAMTKAAIATPE